MAEEIPYIITKIIQKFPKPALYRNILLSVFHCLNTIKIDIYCAWNKGN